MNTNQNHHAITSPLLRTLSGFVAVIMLLTSVSICSVSAYKTYTEDYLYCTASDYVALRKGPSAGSKELDRIPHGDSMKYLNEKSGDWYYVKYGSKKGYVYYKYVTFDEGKVKKTYYCTADDFVSLRKSASASSKELAKIYRGKSMTYLNKKSGKWYYVQYGSKKGYVYGDYIDIKPEPDPNPSILWCTADDYVSLRKSDSASSKELARIPRGEKMGYLNKKSGKWYYVQYGSKKGYVYSDYVSTKKPDDPSSILWCTADDYVSLRKSDSSSSKELARIPRGEKMGYLKKKSGKWYYVQYGSKKGYVYSDYVSSTKPGSKSTSSGSSSSSSSKSSSSSSSKSSSGSGSYRYYYNNNGTGMKCPKCDHGWVVCKSCGGSGKQPQTKRATNYGMGGSNTYTVTVTCRGCGGKRGHSCTNCGGDGKL